MKYLTDEEIIEIAKNTYKKIKDLPRNQSEAILKMIEAMLLGNLLDD